jgi:dimethylargininase
VPNKYKEMKKYTKAIVRRPGKNFADGITSSKLGKPIYEKSLAQHKAYCEALKKCGVEPIVLQADERYPDGCFVEDTAVVAEQAAVITKPGDQARLGEEEKIAEVISKHKKTERIMLPGTLDGGDVLRIGKHFYIGMSQRTNEKGAAQLSAILGRYGFSVSKIEVKDALHLKTEVAYLGNDTVICTEAFADLFKDFKQITVDPNEAYAANCLRVNDYLLIPAGFPKTKAQISALGFDIIELEMSEFQKMDGGLTCLSLLF